MLKQYVETIYDYYNKNATSTRPDFLDGALPFVVQVNNLRGAVIEYDGKWTDCATIPLAYERSETVSVDFECTGSTVSGSDITTLAGDESARTGRGRNRENASLVRYRYGEVPRHFGDVRGYGTL